MSEMPFGTLSVQMLWKLFYLMHQVESGNLDKLSTALLPAECKKHLQGTAMPVPASLSHAPPLFMALFFLLLGGGRDVLLSVLMCHHFEIQETALLF